MKSIFVHPEGTLSVSPSMDRRLPFILTQSEEREFIIENAKMRVLENGGSL
jgi:hypothetical protein